MRLCHSVQPCPSILWGLVDYPALRAVSVSRPKTDHVGSRLPPSWLPAWAGGSPWPVRCTHPITPSLRSPNTEPHGGALVSSRVVEPVPWGHEGGHQERPSCRLLYAARQVAGWPSLLSVSESGLCGKGALGNGVWSGLVTTHHPCSTAT